MTSNIQQWMIIVWIDRNHPKLDDFISGEIIIHFWMVLYGNFHPLLDIFCHQFLDDFISSETIIHLRMILYRNFHPFLDQEHTSLYIVQG
jgi:hypothetical protein